MPHAPAVPVVSLFCGAGGLDHGFRAEGFRIVMAVDSSPEAIRTYNLNAKRNVAVIADLSALSPDKLVTKLREQAPGVRPRGIIGGPPCQGFSRGNVRASRYDRRNRLLFRYAEIVAAFNDHFSLDFFVLENVSGLNGPKHRARLSRLKQVFREAGFNLFVRELDAQEFGVPQRRRRLFMVGLNRELYPSERFVFPEPCLQPTSVRDAIGHLPAPAFYSRGLSASKIPVHPNHWTMAPKSKKFVTGCMTDGRSFRRLLWNEPSPTVAYGNREIHVHPDGTRRLSVYEAMLLQGFPPAYRLAGSLSAQVSLVCNAVPPPVARAIAHATRDVLGSGSRAVDR